MLYRLIALIRAKWAALPRFCWGRVVCVGVVWLSGGLLWASDADDYQVQFQIERQDRQFHAVASFKVPLTACEAYRYLTDYEAAKKVTGVVDSKATRVGEHQVRVERWAEERILMFPVKLHSVVDYTEHPYRGTEFVQREGDAKLFKGQWNIESEGESSIFRFQGVMEPDSALPMWVLQHFIKNKMRDRFAEMARNGAGRRGVAVPTCSGGT